MSVSIPLSLVTPAIFVGLYRLGLTQSAPGAACNIAFGTTKPKVVKAATEALAENRKVSR